MFSDPIKNLKQLGLREDMLVADLGAGTGFYSIPSAKIVTRGKVYAIEIIKEYVATIKNKAHQEHLKNIECFWGNIEKIRGTRIKDGIIDAVIVSNIFSQIEDKEKFIAETKRILKVGGKVLFIDWSELSVFGPKRDKIIIKEKAIQFLTKKGFVYERDISAGEHHYGMILKKL